MGAEALYKQIKRTERAICREYEGRELEVLEKADSLKQVEEVLYAVFTLGFDSFETQAAGGVQQEVCLDALALAKCLYRRYKMPSAGNLMALFCFHIARFPARVHEGKMVSFFDQDRSLWNVAILAAGFAHLKKTIPVDRYYLEALIVGKYMAYDALQASDWEDAARL